MIVADVTVENLNNYAPYPGAYRDTLLELMWQDLSDVPFNEDRGTGDLLLADEWAGFEKGSAREEIWEWFDDAHSKGVAYLLNEYGHRSDIPGKTNAVPELSDWDVSSGEIYHYFDVESVTEYKIFNQIEGQETFWLFTIEDYYLSENYEIYYPLLKFDSPKQARDVLSVFVKEYVKHPILLNENTRLASVYPAHPKDAAAWSEAMGNMMGFTFQDIYNPDDGKRYIGFFNIDRSVSLGVLHITHEYDLQFCVDDGKWYGDTIGPDGWYSISEVDAQALALEIGLEKIVEKQSDVDISDRAVIEVDGGMMLDIEGSGEPVFRNELEKQAYYRGECGASDYTNFKPLGRFIFFDEHNGTWDAMDNSEGKGINEYGFETREEAVRFAQGLGDVEKEKRIEDMAQSAERAVCDTKGTANKNIDRDFER